MARQNHEVKKRGQATFQKDPTLWLITPSEGAPPFSNLPKPVRHQWIISLPRLAIYLGPDNAVEKMVPGTIPLS